MCSFNVFYLIWLENNQLTNIFLYFYFYCFASTPCPSRGAARAGLSSPRSGPRVPCLNCSSRTPLWVRTMRCASLEHSGAPRCFVAFFLFWEEASVLLLHPDEGFFLEAVSGWRSTVRAKVFRSFRGSMHVSFLNWILYCMCLFCTAWLPLV